jgi:hypothetical protein
LMVASDSAALHRSVAVLPPVWERLCLIML